jgi:WD40 repeat protein
MATPSTQTFGANPTTERGTAGKLDLADDGNWLAYASGKTVILRDARKSTICDTYTEHTKLVTVARFAPNMSYVASADIGGAVRMWAQTHPEKMLKKETPVLGGAIFDLAWDHESKRIVAGGDGGKGFQAKAFMAETGSALGEITGHQKPIVSVAIRPSKPSTLVTASQDFKVGFFKGPPYKFACMAMEHTNFVQCVRYSPNGSLVCSVGSDTAIFLVDADTGDSKGTLPGDKNHAGSIYGCSFSPDSKQLLTVGGDKTAKLWDIEKQTVVTTFELGKETTDMQVACCWSKAGGAPVTLSLNGDINFLDVANPSQTNRVKSFQAEPTHLACDWASPSKDIYVGDAVGVVTKFTYEGIGDHLHGKSHEGNICGVVARKGKIASAGFDDMIRWIEGNEFKGGSVPTSGQPIGIANCNNHPEFIAYVTEKKAGVACDGRITCSIDLGFEGCAVGISNDADKLLVGNREKKCVVVYDLSDKCTKITKTDKVLPELLAQANVIAFSPDGTMVAVGDRMKELSLWDAKTFEPKIRQKWVFHTSVINCVAWSPDSKFIATGSVDSQVYIWNPASAMKKTKLAFAHKGGVTGADWASPTELFTCGGDRTVRKWVPELPA